MIVLDASAALELLLDTAAGRRVGARALAGAAQLHAPHLLDIEVASALRRLVKARELTPERAAEALEDLPALPIVRHAHTLLVARIWALRDSVTAYDAAYLALAEALDAPLYTRNSRLARAHGHRARVELV